MRIETSCAHGGRPMSLEIDSELNWRREDGGPPPMVFVPKVDVQNLKKPNIIDDF